MIAIDYKAYATNCWYITEAEHERAVQKGEIFYPGQMLSTTIFYKKKEENSIIEGYLGRRNEVDFHYSILDTYEYFSRYNSRKTVLFSFDKVSLYKVVRISETSGRPLLLTLEFASNALNTMQENKNSASISIHAGNGNVITTGNHNDISSAIKVKANDLNSFREELLKIGIAQQDINEITAIVQTEQPEAPGKWGAKTKGWINKMLQKSVEGTWDISIATAGGMLVEILKHYFNIK
jgi:hypothetical protein